MFKINKIKNSGIAMIEVLIGSFILSTGLLVVVGAFNNYINYALSNQKNIQVAYLLEEALEGVGILRDNNWNNIALMSTTTNYYLFFDGSTWVSTTTPQYIDNDFLRKINIYDVNRNGSGIISEFGTYDPNIKKIVATVEYFQGHGTTTKIISTYLANIYN